MSFFLEALTTSEVPRRINLFFGVEYHSNTVETTTSQMNSSNSTARIEYTFNILRLSLRNLIQKQKPKSTRLFN